MAQDAGTATHEAEFDTEFVLELQRRRQIEVQKTRQLLSLGQTIDSSQVAVGDVRRQVGTAVRSRTNEELLLRVLSASARAVMREGGFKSVLTQLLRQLGNFSGPYTPTYSLHCSSFWGVPQKNP